MSPLSTSRHDTRQTRASRWLLVSLAALVLTISLLAFSLSFSVLQDLAARSSVPASMAWAWPLIVDGSIVSAMLVIFAQRGHGRRATVFPWCVLVFFAGVSIVSNAVHTAVMHDTTQGIPMAFAIFVGAIPPVGLMAASEMLVRLPGAGSRPAAADPEPVIAEEPDSEGPAPVTPVAQRRDTSVDTAGEVDTDRDTPVAVAEDHDSADAPADPPAVTPDSADDTDSEPAEPAVMVPAPRSGLHVLEPVPSAADLDPEPEPETDPVFPEDRAGQVDWIVARAREGREVTKEDLAERMGSSLRTAQRRLAEAREIDPEAFAA